MIRLVPTTDSTQDDLIHQVHQDGPAWPHLAGIHAVHQRAGRGRADRVWDTDLVRALTASVVLRPADPAGWSGLGLLTAAACARALHTLVPGLEVGIKWPNDLIIAQPDGNEPGWAGIAKIGGILGSVSTDSAGESVAIMGMGINLDGTAPTAWATTVAAAGSQDAPVVEADALLLSILDELDTLVPAGAPVTGVADAVTPLCRTLGELVDITTPDGTSSGRAEKIDADGALVIHTADGPQCFLAGDVSHMRTQAQ